MTCPRAQCVSVAVFLAGGQGCAMGGTLRPIRRSGWGVSLLAWRFHLHSHVFIRLSTFSSHPSLGSGDRLMAQCQGDKCLWKNAEQWHILQGHRGAGCPLASLPCPIAHPFHLSSTRLFLSSSALPLCAKSNFSKPLNLSSNVHPGFIFLIIVYLSMTVDIQYYVHFRCIPQ